jgi:thiamine pyrophosphokinase
MPAEAAMAETTAERQRRCVVVVTGAESLPSEVLAMIPPGATIIAADSGLDHALAAGLTPSVVVGDLDSISAEGLKWAQTNATIEEHPALKDLTDTELALRRAANLNPDHLLMLSGGGDRLDHTLAVVGALASRELTSIPLLDALWGAHFIRVLHGPGRTSIDAEIGSTLSIVSIAGTATGVNLTGTRWTLEGAELEPLAGLGVSNVVEAVVNVAVTTGVIAIFHQPQQSVR